MRQPYRRGWAGGPGPAARDPGPSAWASALDARRDVSPRQGAVPDDPRASGGRPGPGAIFLALDFETTGLYPALHRVIEVGALRFRLGPSLEAIEESQLACLVDPGVKMPEDARAIHGISDADLVGAPGFEAVASALLSMAEGATIVAHNVRFDLSFLDAELGRLGLERPAAASIDTVALSRRAFPGRRSYRLGAIAAELGIETGSSHRALDDARACMLLYAACASRL